jgi:hypothetical protein
MAEEFLRGSIHKDDSYSEQYDDDDVDRLIVPTTNPKQRQQRQSMPVQGQRQRQRKPLAELIDQLVEEVENEYGSEVDSNSVAPGDTSDHDSTMVRKKKKRMQDGVKMKS